MKLGDRGRARLAIDAAPDAKLDVALARAARDVCERGQIGWTIGDMHAIEQAVPHQLADRSAEQCLGCGRDEFDWRRCADGA